MRRLRRILFHPPSWAGLAVLAAGAAVGLTTVVAGTTAFAALLGVTSQRIAVSTVLAQTTQFTCTLNVSAADATIDQGSPTGNFGSTADLYVRSSSANMRTLVRFDLSSCAIPATAQVSSATLELYLTQAPSTSRTHEASRVTTSWTEATVTWNNQPSTAATPTSSTTTGTAKDVWRSWSVGPDVQSFVNGSATNNGWRVRDTQESSAASIESKFGSKEYGVTTQRPKLTVVYTN
jgi:hypothetical protein